MNAIFESCLLVSLDITSSYLPMQIAAIYNKYPRIKISAKFLA